LEVSVLLSDPLLIEDESEVLARGRLPWRKLGSERVGKEDMPGGRREVDEASSRVYKRYWGWPNCAVMLLLLLLLMLLA
jgi:hypothetical protein